MIIERFVPRLHGASVVHQTAARVEAPAVPWGVSVFAAVTGVFCVLVAAAAAATDPLEAEREFHLIDRDRDGAITPAEARRSTRYSLFPYVFDGVDLDGSGAVEYREWDRARFYMRSLDAGGPGDAGW